MRPDLIRRLLKAGGVPFYGPPGVEVPNRIRVTELPARIPGTRRFRLKADDPGRPTEPLTAADGLPKLGDPYPDTGAMQPPPGPGLKLLALDVEDENTKPGETVVVALYDAKAPGPVIVEAKPEPQQVTRRCQYCTSPATVALVWFRGPPGSGRTNVRVPYCGKCDVRAALAARGMTASVREGADYRFEEL